MRGSGRKSIHLPAMAPRPRCQTLLHSASRPPLLPPIVAASLPADAHPAHSSPRRVIVSAIIIVALAAALYFGVPIVSRSLNTVSTDDAYVNGHVTFVAARVPGQVDREGVLVDDNYRVKKGDVLVRLDPKPYQVIVDEKRGLRPG